MHDSYVVYDDDASLDVRTGSLRRFRLSFSDVLTPHDDRREHSSETAIGFENYGVVPLGMLRSKEGC